MQIIRSSGVNLPAAASRAAGCAAFLPRSVADLSNLGAELADEQQWLNFRAALEAAGALEAEAGSALPSGEHRDGLQDYSHCFCHRICLLKNGNAFLALTAALQSLRLIMWRTLQGSKMN